MLIMSTYIGGVSATVIAGKCTDLQLCVRDGITGDEALILVNGILTFLQKQAEYSKLPDGTTVGCAFSK